MKHKTLISLFSIILVLSFGSIEQIWACMCRKSETCERYNYSEAVFIGKAIAVEKGKSGPFEIETTTFEIQESFLGETKKEIKVENKFAGSCGVDFQKDKTYLVFAHKFENDEFSTNFCSGNLPIEYANDEINNLKKLSNSNQQGKLFGLVSEKTKLRDEKNEYQPISEIGIQAQNINTGKTYSSITNKDGKYEIIVPKGEYKITPILPNYAEFDYFEKELFKVKEKGCSQQYFSLKNKSKLSGKLVDPIGKPISNVKVELSSTELKEKTWRGSDYLLKTDQNGKFELNNVPSGKYILSLNYFDFPDETRPFPTSFYNNAIDISETKILEIDLGQNIENLEFKVSKRLSEKEITGSIHWIDGSPANDVHYYLEDSEYPDIFVGCVISAAENGKLFSRVFDDFDFEKPISMPEGCNRKTDPHGNFKVSGFTTRKYRIKAEISKMVNDQNIIYLAESELFSVDAHPKELKLVLKEKSQEK